MATLTACQQYALWLAEANLALHRLLTGTKVEALTHADKSMRYTSADLNALRSYVRDLQNKVDACNGLRTRGKAIVFMPVDGDCFRG